MDGVKPWAMVLVSEGSGGRKIEKNENLEFDQELFRDIREHLGNVPALENPLLCKFLAR